MMVQSVLILSEDIVHTRILHESEAFIFSLIFMQDPGHTLPGHYFVMGHALIGIIDDLSFCGILSMRVLRSILTHFLSFKPQS